MFLNSIHSISESVFDKSFCEKIIQLGDQQKLELAKVKDGNQLNRNSYVNWIKDESLVKQITPIINESNEKSNWNFLLRKFEPLQYTVYDVKNHYDWHIDTHEKPYEDKLTRKLSFTICLNDDYTGGDFEMCIPHPSHSKNKYFRFNKVFKQGTIIVFPSHIWHKVHPIISGTRKVLVGWVVGTSFK